MDLPEYIYRSGPSDFDDRSGEAGQGPNTIDRGLFARPGVSEFRANQASRRKSSCTIGEYYPNPLQMAPTTLSRKLLLRNLTPQRQLQIRWRTETALKHGKLCLKTGALGLSNLQISLC